MSFRVFYKALGERMPGKAFASLELLEKVNFEELYHIKMKGFSGLPEKRN